MDIPEHNLYQTVQSVAAVCGQKMKRRVKYPPGVSVCLWLVLLYFFKRRRMAPAPSKPVPSNNSVAGSGTGS